MKRNDRHSVTPAELKLIRVGHVLWAIHKKECGKSENASERRALQAALEQVWDIKRELREELRTDRKRKAEMLRERFGFNKGLTQLATVAHRMGVGK